MSQDCSGIKTSCSIAPTKQQNQASQERGIIVCMASQKGGTRKSQYGKVSLHLVLITQKLLKLFGLGWGFHQQHSVFM